MTDAVESIFVGIDVSKATLEVALDDKARTQTFSNDAADLGALATWPRQTDSTDARALSHFARTLHSSDKRQRLLYNLPTPEQELLLAMVARRSPASGVGLLTDRR